MRVWESRQASHAGVNAPVASFLACSGRLNALCYIDESGTPDLPGNTSHYVLAGLSVEERHWKACDSDLQKLKTAYEVHDAEIHTGWILRSYLEQDRIAGFEKMDWKRRRQEVRKSRKRELLRL